MQGKQPLDIIVCNVENFLTHCTKMMTIKSFHELTSPPSSARTKALLSLVQERTVSVLPSLNRRVMEASYVKQNVLRSWNTKTTELSHVQSTEPKQQADCLHVAHGGVCIYIHTHMFYFRGRLTL